MASTTSQHYITAMQQRTHTVHRHAYTHTCLDFVQPAFFRKLLQVGYGSPTGGSLLTPSGVTKVGGAVARERSRQEAAKQPHKLVGV